MRASDGLSQRQKSALFQKEAIERSEKVGVRAPTMGPRTMRGAGR